MAKEVKTKKGFKVLEVSRSEIISCFGGYGICDYCNSTSDNGYYVAVLNQWFCPKCYQEWYLSAKYYPEDAAVEQRNFDNAMLMLDDAAIKLALRLTTFKVPSLLPKKKKRRKKK